MGRGSMGDGVQGQSSIGVGLVTSGLSMRLRISTGKSRRLSVFTSSLAMMI